MFSNDETRATAQAVLDYIHSNPEKHNQKYFFGVENCNTTMCIAGTTLFLNGIDRNNFFGLYENELYSTIAGPMLGFESERESDWLFYEMNNEVAVQKLKHLVVGDIDSIDFDNVTANL